MTLKMKRLLLVQYCAAVFFFTAWAMEHQDESLQQEPDWVKPVTKRGVREYLSHSDLQGLVAMERYLVSHDPSEVKMPSYGLMENFLKSLAWNNDRERNWLIGYAYLGCVPVFYRALDLELQVIELKSARGQNVDQDLKNFCKHLLKFFMCVKADLEYIFMTTGVDKQSFFDTIKVAFSALFFQPTTRHCFKTFLQQHSKDNESFKACVDAAASWLCSKDMTHDFNDWVISFLDVDGMVMQFEQCQSAQRKDPVAPDIVNESYREIVAVIAQNWKELFNSVYEFLGGRRSGTTTPRPQSPGRGAD